MARCLGWAILLHLIAGTILAAAWVVFIAGSSAVALTASCFVDVPAVDPLAPVVGGLERMWAAAVSGVVALAVGFAVLGLGWLWLKIFWRLSKCLTAIGLVPA